MKLSKMTALLLVLAFFSGCATAYDKKGVYHRVQGNESLAKVAKYYHVSVQELAEWNNIANPDEIQAGLKLYIPKKHHKESVQQKKLPNVSSAPAAKAEKEEEGEKFVTFDRGRFAWPIAGNVMSPFGFRNGRRHDGIDIKAKSGTPIKAAAKGEVVFSGRLKGYGQMIILKHKDNFFTVYAHNSANKTRKGQKVAKGTLIGYVGATGRATGPHLHFEVREGQSARNPLFLLPSASEPAAAAATSAPKDEMKEMPEERVASKENWSRREAMMEKLKAKKQPAKKDVKQGG